MWRSRFFLLLWWWLPQVLGQRAGECCGDCQSVPLPFNAVVTVSSFTCPPGEVAVVENITMDGNGTMVARISSDLVNWYNNSHGGFGTRDNLLFARTCFNEFSARGGVSPSLYVIAQCLSQDGCSIRHRESYQCEKLSAASNCSCVGCLNQTSLRGPQDQEVLAQITCPLATDEVVIEKMNAASPPNHIFNLLVQEDPDSSVYFSRASVLSATCGLVSNFKLPGVRSVAVVARCATEVCDVNWSVALRCESSLLPFSCDCEGCGKALSLKAGESKSFTAACPMEVGVAALRFVSRNQGFRFTSNSVYLSSPQGRSSVCFFSPKGILWTGQKQLDMKVECFDSKGCDFIYELSTACECACDECNNTMITLSRGQSQTWNTPVCGVEEKPVLNTLRVSSSNGQFLLSVLSPSNRSLADTLPRPGRTGCVDAYLTKPLAVTGDLTVQAKCLSEQCSLQHNVSFMCQPANSYVISMVNSTKCLSLVGSSLALAPCDVSSTAQRFSFSLANPKAPIQDSSSPFFLNRVVVFRPFGSLGCVSPLVRLLPTCGPAGKLRVNGRKNSSSFSLGGRGKAGGCLVGQNSSVVRSSSCINSAWSVFAVFPLQ